jgi:hypothetical protein
LGINGTYDFQLAITPTITVDVSEVPDAYLKLKIQAYGPGFPLSNAYLNYLMFWANTSADNYPIMNYNFTSDILQTDSSGIAFKEFQSLSSDTAFTFIVKASTAGINGIGYLSQETVTGAGSLIPYIQSYDSGTANVSLTQNPQTGMGPLYFNASFYVLPDNFVPISAGIFSGSVGNTAPSQNLQIITDNQTGFSVVAYGDGNSYGMVITPIGVNSIGASVTFGANPSGKNWVATDLRQVLIGDIAYQAKLSLWSLQGYQVIG